MNIEEKARRFGELHRGGRILVLPNAWDVATARVIEGAGFPAVATTSAGVAATLGYPDGQRISRDEMLDMVRRIAEAVQVPVTADMEAGYGRTTEEVAETARLVMEAGAIGMNLEDSPDATEGQVMEDADRQVEKIRAVVDVAGNMGVPFVLNARTDVYLRQAGETEGRFEEAVRRVSAYLRAGAGCAFVPGVADAETIGRLARAIDGPLNILAGPRTPPVDELEKLGVARVSIGSGVTRAALTFTQRLAHVIRERGTFTFLEGILSHADVNRLLEREP